MSRIKSKWSIETLLMGKYADVRANIKTGDLICLKANKKWFSKLTRWVTRSEVTHTSIAVWLEGGLYAVEMNAGGNCLVAVSRYNSPFDVYKPPSGTKGLRTVALDMLRNPIHYDTVDLIWIGLRNLCRFKPPRDQGGFVCSTLSAEIYKRAGWSAIGLPKMPAPGELATAMGQARLRARVYQ